jgi:hypothetical protein
MTASEYGILLRVWGRIILKFTSLRNRLAAIVTFASVGVLLYGVLTPAGLILRLFGRDALRLRLQRKAATYWIIRQPPGPASETMSDEF